MGNKISKETENLLHRYFCAAANLYGIIPLYKLLDIYNSQNKTITQEQFLCYVESMDYYSEHFGIIGDDEVYDDVDDTEPMDRNLVAEYIFCFDDFDDYCELREEQLGKPYYIPSKEQLLKYEDDFYFEKTLEFISLRAFLRNQSYLTKENADNIAEELELCARIDCTSNIDLVFSRLKYMGLKIQNEQMISEFMELYSDMSNNTRMHCNCGYTPNELCFFNINS